MPSTVPPPIDSVPIVNFLEKVVSNTRLGRGCRDAINSLASAVIEPNEQPTEAELIAVGVALAGAPSGSLIWRAASPSYGGVLYFVGPDDAPIVSSLQALTSAYDKSNVDWAGLGKIFDDAYNIVAGGRLEVAGWFDVNTKFFPPRVSDSSLGLPRPQGDMDAYLAQFQSTMMLWVSASMMSGSYR